MEMLQGNAPTAIDLYIEDANGRETPQVQQGFAENKLPGMNIGQYFEVSLTASKKGETQTISQLPTALQVVINVPAALKSGEAAVLCFALTYQGRRQPGICAAFG